MAQPPPKRRRGEEKEERRPKKKIKKVKRVDYHSSDEEDEVEGAAYDAPKVSGVARVVQQGPVATGENLKPILKREGLKQAGEGGKDGPIAKAEKVVEEEEGEDGKGEGEGEGEGDEDEDGFEDELARNTALNSIPPARDAPDSEDSADDQDNEQVAEAGAEDLADLEEADENDEPALDSSDNDSESEDSDNKASQTSSSAKAKKKRNDPTAFATSITRILDTKLASRKRPDPILSRSTTASEANKALADNKLDARARAQIRSERRGKLDKGRVEDVLGLKSGAGGLSSTGGGADGVADGGAEGRVDTGKVLEEEKKLKKTAQRGVVKLFNAVRAAQVKGEVAMKQARAEGVVGMRQREERVSEMSKQGFLDLISAGGGSGGGVGGKKEGMKGET
ncbi:pre-60S ribosomal particles component [Recurvomyces mirabilis]|uniref:Pre-60S ribosomal particles component n=1 Tax=Recurvomyces mirabilis TaxID=574656 RepID=A0AAE0WWF0_9PEZI|nr:pre-60S ribosomal particles component [Recurvomyces mirabilis]KAK5161708.1 pre-60S ribosomal particles component [Recurvomyces mirabilis]